MSVDCARVEGDWDLFALGSLDEATQQAITAHLQSGCKECQRKFLEAHATVVSIAATAPPRQPSARVEHELMKRIRGDQKQASSWSWPRWNLAPWAMATASALLAGWLFTQQRDIGTELANARSVIQSLRAVKPTPPVPAPSPTEVEEIAHPSPMVSPPVVSPGASATNNRKLAEMATEIEKLRNENAAISAARVASEQRNAELQSSLTATQVRADTLTHELEAAKHNLTAGNQAEVADLNRQLAESRAEVQRLGKERTRSAQIEALLQSGSMQQIQLRPVDPAAGQAVARVLYSPKGGLLLVADALPKLGNEKCYQLWFIRKGSPAILSGGLLQTSSDGRGFLFAPPGNELAELTGLAITDEPKGGSVSARGHKLLFGASR
jgi:hypothetical protein